MLKKRALILTLAITILASSVPLLSQSALAAPQTFTVNSIGTGPDANTGDGICQTSTPGECTLRAAIQQANNNGNPSDQDVIEFNIAGTGVHTIVQAAGLDYIINQSVKIDGYSQSGSSANTTQWPSAFDAVPTIEIDASAGVTTSSIMVESTTNVVIQGLVLTGSNQDAIRITGSSDVSLFGNYVGVEPNGLVADYPVRGIWATDSDDVLIGGSDPEKRNVIAAGFAQTTIYDNSDDAIVQGNYFGVAADGVTALPSDNTINTYANSFGGNNHLIGGTGAGEGNSFENSLGIALALEGSTNGSILGNRIVGNHNGLLINGGENNIVGNGTTAGRNVISGNTRTGAFSSTTPGNGLILNSETGSLSVKGNYIGVAEDGTSALGNGIHGIIVVNAQNVVIGGITSDEQNIIANNGENGISVEGDNPDAKAAILGNSIYDNGELGIDLVKSGDASGMPTPNDVSDPDSGPNDLLNAPNLKVPTINGSDTDIAFEMDVPAGDYRVEFFSNTSYDPSGFGEGRTYLGYTDASSLGAGPQLFNATLSGNSHSNISAVAVTIDGSTDSGYGVTSEFSAPPSMDNNLEITKSVVDQNTIINGAIAYNVELTNNGEDGLDLTQLTADPGDPLNTALFNDIFPSHLAFDSVIGDATCTEENSASTFGTLFSDRISSTVLSCAYDGGDSVLASGDSLTFTLNFTVNDTSENVFTNYVLTVPSQYDADHGDYEDAVNSGDDIITELGSSIDNLASAATTMPVTDIGLTKTLTNPEDVAQGVILSYDFTYTNHGPDSLNLTEFGTPLATSPLVVDHLHPDLTPVNSLGSGPLPNSYYIDVNNTDLTCLWAGPGSSIYFNETVNTDNGVVACWYTGADPELADDQEINFSMSFEVANDSDLAFANYAIAQAPSNQLSTDPDINAIFAVSFDHLGDIVGQMRDPDAQTIDNFVTAPLPVDIGLSSTIANPQDFVAGGRIFYDLTFTNRGPAAVLLDETALFPSGIASPLFPGEHLALVGATNPGVTCTDFGSGSYVYMGTAAQDHTTYHLANCVSTNSGVIIAPNSSYIISIEFEVSSNPPQQLSLYTASVPSTDPDIPTLNSIFATSTSDIMDTLTNDNFTRLAFSQGGSSGGNDGGESSGGSSSGNGLSSTGDKATYLLVAGGLLILIALGSRRFAKRPQLKK